ncbi:MAG TPA: hypothetical protein VFP84_39540 [Kofleriaceae bacterium]|nr:hypothetical protein [Kofleriaceae bacterium]
MTGNQQLEIVTFVAAPPPEVGATNNAFIDAAYRTLAARQDAGHRVLRACSVRDIDVQLGPLAPKASPRRVRLQIVGHSISGVLSLGASWLADDELATRGFAFPYYALDTNPAALALLAKYVGRLAEVMLVGCNVGGASSFGYAINGRTLTYTLTELFRCRVRGADDVVSPDEFDDRGWYAPRGHRRPQGWRWIEGQPPVWDTSQGDAWDAPVSAKSTSRGCEAV